MISWRSIFVNNVFAIIRSNVSANPTTLSPSSFLSPTPLLPCEVASLPLIPTCPFQSAPIITDSAHLVALSRLQLIIKFIHLWAPYLSFFVYGHTSLSNIISCHLSDWSPVHPSFLSQKYSNTMPWPVFLALDPFHFTSCTHATPTFLLRRTSTVSTALPVMVPTCHDTTESTN